MTIQLGVKLQCLILHLTKEIIDGLQDTYLAVK
jgi:hypothetical protein